jgi:HEPN domain-containing protein
MGSELKEFEKWIQKAESDLTIVEKDIVTDSPVTDVLCFHCQQAAEKYLKAYIVYRNQIPERTHLIERLLNICANFDSEFEKLSDAVLLTTYAVELRYPDDMYFPTLTETKKALKLTKKVKKFVLNKIADTQDKLPI